MPTLILESGRSTLETREERYRFFNLGTIPFTYANVTTTTSALAPAVLKPVVAKQATSSSPSSTNYARDTNSCQTAVAGVVFTVNGQACTFVDGISALLVASRQYIFTNLNAAGIIGFITY